MIRRSLGPLHSGIVQNDLARRRYRRAGFREYEIALLKLLES